MAVGVLGPVPKELQGKRANKKLTRGEVPPLLLKIDGVIDWAQNRLCLLKIVPNFLKLMTLAMGWPYWGFRVSSVLNSQVTTIFRRPDNQVLDH